MQIHYDLGETDADDRVGMVIVGVGLVLTLVSILVVFIGWFVD